jgi:hypothetical protein
MTRVGRSVSTTPPFQNKTKQNKKKQNQNKTHTHTQIIALIYRFFSSTLSHKLSSQKRTGQ